jgi:diguanylate cyclase (GGDEF)-like protein/PAS domain S-box-containing protein
MSTRSHWKKLPLWWWGFILVIAATALAFLSLRHYEEQRAEADFQTAAVERLDQLEGSIELTLDQLIALGAYYDSAGEIDRARFYRLTQPLLHRGFAVQALEWIPRVTDAERERLTQSARHDGYPGFDFTERTEQGVMASAKRRPIYYPVYFVEPYRGNEKALGFDLASLPSRRSALEQAAASGQMTATGRITLVQGNSDQCGFLVFRPVYRPDTSLENPARLAGFVLAVFKIGDIVEHGSENARSRIRLLLSDEAADPGKQILYPRQQTPEMAAPLPTGFTLNRHIEVAGRSWHVTATPQPGAFSAHHQTSTSVLALGLLIAGLWAAYLRQVSRQRSVIERTVEERTIELNRERNFSDAIFNSEGGITLVIDRAGEIVLFNHAAEVFTGYSFEEVRNQPFFWQRFLPPEQRAGVHQIFEHFHDGSLPRRYENHWVSRSGEQRLFDWTNTIIVDRRGTPQFLVTIGLDITERNQAEENLRASELRFRRLFERNNAPMLLVDPEDGNIVDANASACTFYGWPHDEICSLHIEDINQLPPDEVRAERLQALQEKRNSFIFTHRLADGQVRTVEVHSTPIRVGDKDVLISIIHDISERTRAEAQVRQLLNEQGVMLDNALVGIVKVRDRTILWANRAFETMLGYGSDELNGLPTRQLYPSQADYESLGARAYPIIQAGGHFRDEIRHLRKDGKVIWADISGAILDHGKEETLWVFLDITNRKKAEMALHDSETMFHTMVDWTYDWEYWINPDGHLIYTTPSTARITGHHPEEFEADTNLINTIVHPEDRHLWERHVHYHLPEDGRREVAELEFRIVRKQGEVLWVNHTCRPVFDAEGHYQGRRVAVRDITDRKRAEDEIRHLAYFDPLTHLPNRRLLMDRLSQALIASNRSREFGALMILDLDHFKSLNDTQGHDVGDRLLVEVAQRLSTSVRQEDTVSRLGGDEYVVMLEGLGPSERIAASQAESVAEKIRIAINQPFVLGGSEAEYYSTPSIGLTLFQGQTDPAEVLLKQADVALYQAKDSGRNAVRFFNSAMQSAIDSRTALESALRRGLDRGEFRLYYQPQVDQTGRSIGAEALIRWLPPNQGVISPAQFIPLAEESGLILSIGQWVLETACAQLKHWELDPLTRDLLLSVNVSARQFHQLDFVEQVRQSLLACGANPARLKLELTESVVLDNVEEAISRMQQLHSLGIGFSLDDFGTGYSSLSYLKRLPLDQIKIDQSFIRDINQDPNDAAIVRAILAMSRSLGLQVIAEGVETQAQRDFLFENGCTAYQGYLFGYPVPIEAWGKNGPE